MPKRTAFVDLSTGHIDIQPTPAEDLEQFLGCRGYAAKLLFERVGPEIGPLDPSNCLIFSTGPLTGTPFPTGSRSQVTFRSPATGGYGYANTGGHFGAELKQASYDAVVVTGRASDPVYLRITNDSIEIRDASHLWGQLTSQVEGTLLADGGGRVACIGPAGEHLCNFAAIINDQGRAAARAGPGAVMGSKLLKAVQVIASGREKLPQEFLRAAGKISKHVLTDSKLEGLRSIGTPYLLRPKNAGGDLPARNHQRPQVDYIDRMDAATVKKFLVTMKGCFACPVRCSHVTEVKEGPYQIKVEGPEYETTNSLGPMLDNDSMELIIYANHLCNEYGLDTISTGVVIAFAMECHEKGLLSDPELSLEWGDHATILGLLEKIAYRRGTGDLLAFGVRQAAELIGNGAEQYAMHVKGLELPRQEPRFAKGFGLGHCTSNRGACHLYALPAIDLGGNFDVAQKLFAKEIIPQLMDSDDETYKPDMVVYG
ncbi:MAG: aldehyde ferredoxin oxidoreductase, partial [Deinococcus sp.]|nr:aldehyde ferredoxin oxidoreductase [Deinococcus sp.]